MENVKKSKPDLFTTPRTVVSANSANPGKEEVLHGLFSVYNADDARKMIDLWYRTQIRDPLSVDEVEEIFFGEVFE